MKKLLFLLCAFPLYALAATPLPPATAAEIDQLLSHLEHSGCKFSRNGSWYNAKDARQHINKKLEYLVEKGMLKKTEDFIEKAASQSSTSGKPYLVQCGDGKATPSGPWFTEELMRLRKQAK